MVSFQNRWTSFDDPGRWLVRFEKKMARNHTYGNADPEFHQQHFPNYWHSIDYMQYRLIGPVVMAIHENLDGSPGALNPGTYPVEPWVSYWGGSGAGVD